MANNATVDRPHGIDVRNLLDAAGYDLDGDRSATLPGADASKAHPGVETAPLLFVEDEAIEDPDDLRRWLARNAH